MKAFYSDTLYLEGNVNSSRMKALLFDSYNHNYSSYLPTKKDSPILEIGCSTGTFLSYLKQSGYVNTVGIDVDAKAIDYCRKNE